MKTYMPIWETMQDFAKTYMPNVCQSVRRNFFQKMAFFQNGSKPCSRGRYRYYDQFAESIALRSFF